MRVVIHDPDAEIRDTLQQAMDERPEFLLVGESRTWHECEALLDAYLPELLVTRISAASQVMLASTTQALFPVWVGLRPMGSPNRADCAFETLEIPLDQRSLGMMLERVRTEIYRRKLDELSGLLSKYMSFSRGLPPYQTSLRIEGSAAAEIPAGHVIFIAADGNYVRVYAGMEVHELRDTMSGMASRLDPAQFARVHRSFIVNRAHVTSVQRKDGTALSVLLSNGTEIPVGPNFRAEADSFDSLSRMSA
jgi:two-component system LytT family response regulator